MKLGLHAHYTSSSDASENPARSHLHACDAEQIGWTTHHKCIAGWHSCSLRVLARCGR